MHGHGWSCDHHPFTKVPSALAHPRSKHYLAPNGSYLEFLKGGRVLTQEVVSNDARIEKHQLLVDDVQFGRGVRIMAESSGSLLYRLG